MLLVAPEQFQALHWLGMIETACGRPQAGCLLIERALAVDPRSAAAHIDHAHALNALGAHREAIRACDAALAIDPRLPAALSNRGVALAALGQHQAALADYDAALALQPDQPAILHNRNRAQQRLADAPYVMGARLRTRLERGDWRDFETALSEIEAGVRAGSRVIEPFSFLGVSSSAADQLLCARRFAADHAPAPTAPLWTGERYRHDRIRIAYLSADFAGHATAVLIEDLIALHDREHFEIVAISFGAPRTPAVGQSLAFDRIIEVRAQTDAEAASLIRQHEIDIAVDLMGYTTQCRPGILALRPAPVQVSYLGFPGTLGSASIDYLIADRVVVPEAAGVHYQERIVSLPDTYQCNPRARHMTASAPERSAFGLPERGFVFCCFNATAKILPPLFTVWMRVLQQVPGSVLWLLAPGGDGEGNLRREAGKRGIDPQRLVFARRLANPDHLARYQRADLFLDTLPYNAHTTASDALWVGLPVLTCLGTSFAGRVGASLLHAIGLPELIMPSIAAYETAAVALAHDPAALAGMRDRLRHNRQTHALFDADRFRCHIEAAYVGMQGLHDRGEPPRDFAVPPLP